MGGQLRECSCGRSPNAFTESIYQYAAYYSADGSLMLAKRRIGEDTWQTQNTSRETSGTAFITYALAWGLNHKVLDEKTYKPAVIKAWNSLTTSVTSNGKLENVQPIGAPPHGFDPSNSEPFATGAFLMAASEVYGLTKR